MSDYISPHILLKPGQEPRDVLPLERIGERDNPDVKVLCTWGNHPDEVPLGLWVFMGRKSWVTHVKPEIDQVVMTPEGRRVTLGATVYGYEYVDG